MKSTRGSKAAFGTGVISKFTTLMSVLLALVLLTGHASANEALGDPLAKELKATGDSAMQEGRFEEALSAYERAAAVEATPSLHFNRARALQALRRYPEALAEFEAFRAEASPELQARVQGLDDVIERVKSQITWLSVVVSEAGAEVLLREVSLGKAPLSKAVPVNAGSARLVVRKPGFDPEERNLDLPGGQRLALKVELSARDRRGVLRVTSPVAGARVEVDEKRVGTTPSETRLEPGRHTVRVLHPDHQPVETFVVLSPLETKAIDVAMEAKPSFYHKWWFWTAVGAVAVTGTVTVIALTREKDPDKGDIPPGTVRASLLSF